MDAHSVGYVGGLGRSDSMGMAPVFHPVARVAGKFSRLVLPYHLIDLLVGYALALQRQIAGDLLRRPLLARQ